LSKQLPFFAGLRSRLTYRWRRARLAFLAAELEKFCDTRVAGNREVAPDEAVELCLALEDPVEQSDSPTASPAGASRQPVLIDDLEISVRSYNALQRRGIATVSELLLISEEDLLRTRNLGAKSVGDIIEALRERGLFLRQTDVDPVDDASRAVLEEWEVSAPKAATAATHPLDASQVERNVSSAGGSLAISSLAGSIEAAILATEREPHRRLAICRYRLGFFGEAETLQVVGERFGITRERVRQIVASTLRRLTLTPVGAAFRYQVEALLDVRVCVTADELPQLSSWLSGISPSGMEYLIEGFCLDRYWTHQEIKLVSREPRIAVMQAIDATLERITALRTEAQAQESIAKIALDEASIANLPALAPTLASIAHRRHAQRHFTFTFTDFVREHVATSDRPISLSALREVAVRHGFSPSEVQLRNTLAGCDGVYPLGQSLFGTFVQTFGGESSKLDEIAATVARAIEQQPGRQAHAEELLNAVTDGLDAASSALLCDPYRLAALLRERTSLRYLGRLVFGSGEHNERLLLSQTAQRVLADAGEALPLETLVERVRAVRGISKYSVQNITTGLLEVRPGVWALPSERKREQFSDPFDYEHAMLVEDAFAALKPGDVLDVAVLRGRMVERGSAEAEAIDAAGLKAVLARDGRFHTGPRATVRLSDQGPRPGYAT
jgi:hypothetical protein